MNQEEHQKELIERTVKWLEGYEEARRHVPSDMLLSDFREIAAGNYKDSVLVPAGLGWMDTPEITRKGGWCMVHGSGGNAQSVE